MKHLIDKLIQQYIAEGRCIVTKDGPMFVATPEAKGSEIARLADGDERWIRHLTASVQKPDRNGDIVIIKGIRTDAFARNPQFIWNHGKGSTPDIFTLGRVLKLTKTADSLKATVEYINDPAFPMAAKIYQLDCRGFLPSQSIGFRPITFSRNEFGGVTFHESELLEISKVTVPMNPHAND
jgi:hypothetical protein